MTQKTMYDTIIGTPSTSLTAPFHAGTDSVIHVKDGTFLPVTENTASVWIADRTFLAVIRYTARVGNTLNGVTIVQGTPVEALTATFPIGAVFARPVSQDDMQAIQDNIRDVYAEVDGKLDRQYTATQDGFIAKVDSYDHVLKVMPASAASVTFADITGQPTDNTSLAAALNAKIGKQYTAAEDGYLAKVDPTDHTLKVMAASPASVTFSDITGQPTDNTLLNQALESKLTVREGSIEIGDDANGTYIWTD
ncbi:MAG TPA: hypothetical protein O0X27_05180 [Methanocorpusculum sp.]|nr:hypothetical protein [Methanocorpusculum sp.]